jgi:hypothetical protein
VADEADRLNYRANIERALLTQGVSMDVFVDGPKKTKLIFFGYEQGFCLSDDNKRRRFGRSAQCRL